MRERKGGLWPIPLGPSCRGLTTWLGSLSHHNPSPSEPSATRQIGAEHGLKARGCTGDYAEEYIVQIRRNICVV
ncbi:hypothetical protein Pmani_039203 [Petrolisthes manimaculis]|uniref:Uncharacterized protein n=1 Tax=Petrolisthes manimaculis TaxID=1843537 RepID=A0AAE1TLK8_9EUCA|nr:hypothetical protein Pmani_039203 [Petrolisthes manimaculis]